MVWVLTSCRKDFTMSPDGFEGVFINVGDSYTKEEIRVEESTVGSPGGALFGSLEML